MRPAGTEATLMPAICSKNIQKKEPTTQPADSQDVICEVRLNLFIDIYLKLLQKRTSSNIAKSTFGTQMAHLSLWIPQKTRLTWLSIPQWRTYNNSTVIGFRTHSPQRRELHSPCTCSIVSCDAFCRYEISWEKAWCATFHRCGFRQQLLSWPVNRMVGSGLWADVFDTVEVMICTCPHRAILFYPLSYLIPLS